MEVDNAVRFRDGVPLEHGQAPLFTPAWGDLPDIALARLGSTDPCGPRDLKALPSGLQRSGDPLIQTQWKDHRALSASTPWRSIHPSVLLPSGVVQAWVRCRLEVKGISISWDIGVYVPRVPSGQTIHMVASLGSRTRGVTINSCYVAPFVAFGLVAHFVLGLG